MYTPKHSIHTCVKVAIKWWWSVHSKTLHYMTAAVIHLSYTFSPLLKLKYSYTFSPLSWLGQVQTDNATLFDHSEDLGLNKKNCTMQQQGNYHIAVLWQHIYQLRYIFARIKHTEEAQNLMQNCGATLVTLNCKGFCVYSLRY